jgi:penicillin-binding protein 2
MALTEINKQDGAPELRRRATLLYALIVVVFVSLFTRLSYLQMFQGERYTYLSENNRIRLKRVPGSRGMIVDRQGQLLVDSRPSFDLFFVPEDSEQP